MNCQNLFFLEKMEICTKSRTCFLEKNGDNLHEMLKPVFCEKKKQKQYFKMSVEMFYCFTQHAKCENAQNS